LSNNLKVFFTSGLLILFFLPWKVLFVMAKLDKSDIFLYSTLLFISGLDFSFFNWLNDTLFETSEDK
jgi:hypothetical protein